MKKVGRPKGNNNMERVCTIRMDNNTLVRLERYCEYMHMAKSEAIRVAINKMVDEEDGTMNEDS
jgi:predicted transcriptional regulator